MPGFVPGIIDYATRIYATWDPAHKGGSCTLSGGNLVATFSGANSIVNANIGKSAGLWYWEITVTAIPSGFANIGIQNALTTGNFLGNISSQFAYWNNAQKTSNGIGLSYGATYTVGDIIGTAMDLNAGTVTMYKNGVSQGLMYSGLSGTFFPAVSQIASGSVTYTANFGGSVFPFGVPSGFNPGLF